MTDNRDLVKIDGKLDSSPVWKKFFEMEEHFNLFNLSTQDNLPLWDIVRMDIYLRYHFPQRSSVQKSESRNSLIYFWKHLRAVVNSFLLVCLKDGENFFYTCSRYKNPDGLYYDKALMNIICSLGKKKSFILEWQDFDKKYCYRSVNNYLHFYRRITGNSKKQEKFPVYQQIREALIGSFGECKVSKEEVEAQLNNFRAEHSFYSKIFKLKKTKRVFINQNGLQKGMIKAARDLDIKVYEVQHGSFEIDHLAYSYPPFISKNSSIIFPDVLLTFSRYWGSNLNVPADKIVPVGNDYFALPASNAKKDSSILIVSSMIHGNYLYPWAIDLAKKHPEKQIMFKLHSNEYRDFDYYKNMFSSFTNIHILKNEKDISFLIQAADVVILINSTVAYEALGRKTKVVICKRGNYIGLQSLFKMPNVFLADNVEDIELALHAPLVNQSEVFFTAFNKEVFLTTL